MTGKNPQVVMMKVSDVIPYDSNPRLNDDAVDSVADSIRNYGFRNPVIVDRNNVIICGHTRRLAAIRLGLDEIPVIVADDMPEDKVKAFRIDDNKTAEFATWDFSLLQQEMSELEGSGFDLSTMAFSAEELSRIMGDNDEAGESSSEDGKDMDSVAETGEGECDSADGEMYQLGNSVLLCGDCSDESRLDMLLEGRKADIMLTDPPYGIGAANGIRTTYGHSTDKGREYEGDWDSDVPPADVMSMLLSKANESIVFGGNYMTDRLPVNGHWIVWDKKGEFKFNNPFSDCELAWTSMKKDIVKKYTVIQQGFVNDGDKRVHPTQKPFRLISDILEDYAKDGFTVFDPFSGSGTTLMACESKGLKCLAVEKSPHYCDVIRKRWAESVHGEGCDWKSLTKGGVK